MLHLFALRVFWAVTLSSSLSPSQGQHQGREDHGKFGTWFWSSKALKAQDVDDDVPQLERKGDAPAKTDASLAVSSEPFIASFGGYTSVQVNVNAKGKNIVGDAANEPSIAVDPLNSNRIAVGWRQFDSVTSNFREAGNAYSTDGGKTWHNNTVLTKGTFRSDPVLGFDAKGNFYYNSLLETFYTTVFESPLGSTWTTIGPAMGGDKQWMAIDATTGPGKGNLYETWSTAGNNYGGKQFTRSTDGGKTWLYPIDLPGSPVWGTMDIAPNGDLYIGALGNSSFEFIRSSNAKYPIEAPTFDMNVPVNLGGGIVLGTAINPDGLMGQTWIATDKSTGPNSGNIYMLCSVGVNTNNPCDVNFSRSTDGGATWSSYARINDDAPNVGASHWFGTLSVASNGRIDVCWYDNRSNPASTTSALFYTFSYDGGLTWAPSTQVSPAFNPNIGYPDQNKMGDYLGMVSDATGRGIVYGATFNGEEDIWFLRIPTTAVQPVIATAITPIQGTNVAGTLASIQAIDRNTYNIQSAKVSGSESAEAEVDFVMPTVKPEALSVQISAKAVAKVTGGLYIYNWTTKTYEFLQSFPFDSTGNASTTLPIKSISSTFFDKTGRLKIEVRASMSGTKAFPFQIDLLQLLFG